jgi:hypothetical protein
MLFLSERRDANLNALSGVRPAECMGRPTSPRCLCLLAFVLSIAGCSQGSPTDDGQRDAQLQSARRAQPSSEERQAAAALSIVAGALPESASGYLRAVSCAASLHFLGERLKGTQMVGAEQKQALARGAQIFEDQARAMSSDDGKTASQVASDMSSAEEKASTNPAEAARTAMSCLRTLAGAG